MNIENITSPELIVRDGSGITNKKKLFETISILTHCADNEVKQPDILEALLKRERLGVTSLSDGVAIPHARISSLSKPLCVIIVLSKPICYCNEDDILVDIIFGLLVPEGENEEHLKILATLAEKLKNASFREALRTAKTQDEIYQYVIKTDE
jgi:PTS system nitrogen regulatory IIA component